MTSPSPDTRREHRRRRIRRRGRRAYVRSVYFLPSLATLGNAICGFAAIYVAGLTPEQVGHHDPLTERFAAHPFTYAAGLVFLAMVFDALDGRLARLTRHTTDFGGQLDSLADVISFGAAPAFIALQVFKAANFDVNFAVTRLVWAIGALYLSCAALRLARFNVSNEHGEQHHFSFLGLPSPGAGGAVAAFVLMLQQFSDDGLPGVANVCTWLLPLVVLGTGLLMVSDIRYPHIVNRYMKGQRSILRLVVVVALLLALLLKPQYTLGISLLAYPIWGIYLWAYGRAMRNRPANVVTPPTTT